MAFWNSKRKQQSIPKEEQIPYSGGVIVPVHCSEFAAEYWSKHGISYSGQAWIKRLHDAVEGISGDRDMNEQAVIAYMRANTEYKRVGEIETQLREKAIDNKITIWFQPVGDYILLAMRPKAWRGYYMILRENEGWIGVVRDLRSNVPLGLAPTFSSHQIKKCWQKTRREQC